MSYLAQDFEYQRRTWKDTSKVPRLMGRLDLGTNWIVEIKPHTTAGLRKGLAQLNVYRFGTAKVPPSFPNSTQWLVTYVGVDQAGNPIATGMASAVRVFAREVRWINKSQHKLLPLHDIGKVGLKPTIRFPRVDEPGFFGSAVERIVRGHFFRRKSGTADRGGGGASPGPDAKGRREIAELYGELARLTGDRLYAELSAEFQPLIA